MQSIIIHRIATTAVMPLVAASGWAGYSAYPSAPAPVPVCTVLTTDARPQYANQNETFSLQRFLIARGYMRGTATGYFGQETFISLQRFQADNGIPVTGVADAQTRARIQELSCAAPLPAAYPRTYPATTYQSVPTRVAVPTYAPPAYTYQNYSAPSTYDTYGTYYPYGTTGYGNGYPAGCSSSYDRACYVNGQYVGPAYGASSYNGAVNSCYTLDGQWTESCGAGSAPSTYSVHQPSYNGTYVDTNCYYDRACLARAQGRAY